MARETRSLARDLWKLFELFFPMRSIRYIWRDKPSRPPNKRRLVVIFFLFFFFLDIWDAAGRGGTHPYMETDSTRWATKCRIREEEKGDAFKGPVPVPPSQANRDAGFMSYEFLAVPKAVPKT
jgi:hypothetical protein